MIASIPPASKDSVHNRDPNFCAQGSDRTHAGASIYRFEEDMKRITCRDRQARA